LVKELPYISIVTPSLNQGAYIEENIKSVLNQNYPDFEHIIIDGGSTDGTIDILKEYKHLIWISERDRGQSAAINKGFRRAKGHSFFYCNPRIK
jgi:glycosyltransferase involved in cell wall biosynthesis